MPKEILQGLPDEISDEIPEWILDTNLGDIFKEIRNREIDYRIAGGIIKKNAWGKPEKNSGEVPENFWKNSWKGKPRKKKPLI